MIFTDVASGFTRVESPFSAQSIRTLLAMIGVLQSWVSYLFGASVGIGLMISGAILMLP
jgi:hypothetical protein